MLKPLRISYLIILGVLVACAWLRLATPLLTILFSYFALTRLNFGKRRWVAVLVFCLVVGVIFYGFTSFVRQSLVALPQAVSVAIPKILLFAKDHNVELPFDDLESLKTVFLDNLKDELSSVGKLAKLATKETAYFVIGIVVAASMFLTEKFDLAREDHRVKNNLYSLCSDEIMARFRTFYQSFATVIGAQLAISAINTALTGIFVVTIHLPHAVVVIGATFLCGLLPIIGNILSNSVIVCISFTISAELAIASLLFLVVLHKLEYFLNSKIIGQRIKNPIWLTLLSLLIGERLMGIPGMILAPVILNYCKIEASRIEIDTPTES